VLLFDLFGQMGQVGHGAVDLASCVVEVRACHQRSGARQTSARTLGNRQHHIEISYKFFG
jgi:hypothetical protein